MDGERKKQMRRRRGRRRRVEWRKVIIEYPRQTSKNELFLPQLTKCLVNTCCHHHSNTFLSLKISKWIITETIHIYINFWYLLNLFAYPGCGWLRLNFQWNGCFIQGLKYFLKRTWLWVSLSMSYLILLKLVPLPRIGHNFQLR